MHAPDTTVTKLESHFETFRAKIIGNDLEFETPYGNQKLIYADWTASGRLYAPIEHLISDEMGKYVGNTHTETTITGTSMTKAYHKAHEIIKNHVHASSTDVIITCDSGMTGVVNKFQRILGLKIPEKLEKNFHIPPNERPVVFVTHMEHHSNHTSWLETIADVECILPDDHGLVNLEHLKELLDQYADREVKIASVTACSNVTGIQTDYHAVARVMHENAGLCFVDFACSAPYAPIDMHPKDEAEKLDAIYFSPHKFLGGPGTTGVLIFCNSLYHNRVPDQVGGGTVTWTNPWGEHAYFDDIEVREDGGTPAFLQTIKAALCVKLKDKMGIPNILQREHEIVEQVFERLPNIPGLHILAGESRDRLGVFSFYIENLHFNLGVKLLNDRFGVQTRGGCSCAGTYGHYLLHIPKEISNSITDKIDDGVLDDKPGWLRMSIHPTMSSVEINFILDSIEELAKNHVEWANDYVYDQASNEFQHKKYSNEVESMVGDWFNHPM